MKSLLFALGLSLFTTSSVTAETIASVNDVNIEKSEVQRYVAQSVDQGAANTSELRAKILNDLILKEVLLQEAERRGLDREETFEMRLDDLRAELLTSTLIQSLTEEIDISEEEIRNLYDVRADNLSSENQYDVQVIITKTKKSAMQVIDMIDEGADFAEVARNFSIDASSVDGGTVGWRLPSELVRDLANVIGNLPLQTITNHPIQSNQGWYVLRVNAQRPFEMPKYQQVLQILSNEILREKLQESITDLRERAVVK